MNPTAGFALAAFALAAAAGCSHNVQIPPARPLGLEAPATVGAERHRVRAQVAQHGALFNGDFQSGDLRLRTGLSDRLELAVDGSVLLPEAAANRPIYLGRIGGKLNLAGGRSFALTGGLGGGASPGAGGMISADGGFIVGIDNPYVVPFFAVSTFMSAPIAARPVRTGEDAVDTPSLTGGTGATAGLSVIRDRFTLAVGLDVTTLRDEDGAESFFSLGAGLELALD